MSEPGVSSHRRQAANPLSMALPVAPPRPNSAPGAPKRRGGREKKSGSSKAVSSTHKPPKHKSNPHLGKLLAQLGDKKNDTGPSAAASSEPPHLALSMHSDTSVHPMPLAARSRDEDGKKRAGEREPSSPREGRKGIEDAEEKKKRRTDSIGTDESNAINVDTDSRDKVPDAHPPAPLSRADSQILDDPMGDEEIHGDLAGDTPKKVLQKVVQGAFIPTPTKRRHDMQTDEANPQHQGNILPTPTTHPNPITYLKESIFRPIGALPNGFPEARDLNKDTQAGKLPVKGQSRFSEIDILCSTPLTYHNTTPLPPKNLLALLNPTPQILIYGDSLPYHGFFCSFSLADLPTLEWNKLAGLAIFNLLPFLCTLLRDEPPFLSQKTIVKQLVSLLRCSKKKNKVTTIWLAYCSRSNAAACEFASILDRRIHIIPALSFLYVTVVCSIVHLAYCRPDTHKIVEHPSPLDHRLILMHLSSIPLPKQHVPRTIEFYPKCMPDVVPGLDLYVPTPSLFQPRIDIPSRVTLEVQGNKVIWDITGTLPLMLLLNGLSPDDTCTVLKDIVAPKITKEFWPVVVNASPEGYKIFDFHVPIHILS